MNSSFGARLRLADRFAALRRSTAPFSRWLAGRTRFRRRIPIRGRIALFGAAVVAVTVVVFSVLMYVSAYGSLTSNQDSSLRQQGDRLWVQVASGRPFRPGASYPFTDLNTSSAQFVELIPTADLQTFSTVTIKDQPPLMPNSLLRSASSDQGRLDTVKPKDGPLMRVYIRAVGTSGYVIVGQPLFGIEDQLRGLRLFLIAGVLLSLLGAAAASWFVAGRALRPLDAMASTAEDIGESEDLSRRLPVGSTNDEVGRLQRSFNQMLRQLEDAYLGLRSALIAQRRFVADASHELRTPLTTIRGNVGLLLKRDDITSEDRVAALNDIAGESERMSRMVQDLLTLARADAGYHLEMAPIDLLPIAQEVSRQAQTLQPARRIELLDGAPAPVEGNADAIKQLLWILIDNAFKHTPDSGRIQLRLDTEQGGARLMVLDDGPGIPQEDLERIFERFFQSDASRSGEGTGLGLAIARWIAREHMGQVTAANNPQGGAAFTVEFPIESKVLAKS